MAEKKLTQAFCQEIIELNDERIQLESQLNKEQAEETKAEKKKEYHHSKLSWWEKRFGSWFFGNPFNVNDYKKSNKAHKKEAQDVNVVTSELNQVKDTLEKRIHDELMRLDAHYKARYEIHVKLEEVVEAGNRCKVEIDEAQIAVSSASSMEVLDLMSDNQAFSILSYVETSDAEDEVDDAKDHIQKFNKKLTSLISYMDGIKDVEFDGLGMEGLDLVFDFTLGKGFDIFSALNLTSLWSTDSKLEIAEEELEKILEALEPNLSESENELITYRQTVINKILEGIPLEE